MSQKQHSIEKSKIHCYSFKGGKEVSLFIEHVEPLKEFMGQKLLHLLPTERIDPPVRKEKKGKRRKRRKNYKPRKIMVYKEQEFDEELIKRLHAAVFYLKHDGMCGMFYEGVWYTRIDIKKNKSGVFDESKIRDDWIPCEPKPTHKDATHWPHFRPFEEKGNRDKWQKEARKEAIETGILSKLKEGRYTIEYMGDMCNKCLPDRIDSKASVVLHRSIRVDIPPKLRCFEGIKSVLKELCIEGLIVYFKNGEVKKIKREMFMDGDSPMKWKDSPKEEWIVKNRFGLSDLVALKK